MRSAAVMSVALGMANAGWGWADFHREMTDPSNGLADWTLRRANGTPRGREDGLRRLERAWEKAEARSEAQPAVRDRVDVTQALGMMRAEAMTYPWSERAGRNAIRDRKVHAVLLDLATERGTLTPSVSVRALTELTPYRGWKTVCRALESLVAQGLIRRQADGPVDQANRYHLLPVEPVSQRHNSSHAELGGTGVSLRDADETPGLAPVGGASTRLGLVCGAHAAAVHAALVEFPMPVSALVSRSGVSRPTVYRWLPRLARMGLARETPAGWVLGDTDPETVAFEHGADLVEHDRHERHEKSRADYRRSVTEGRQSWVEQRDEAVAKARAARRRRPVQAGDVQVDPVTGEIL